MNTDEKGMITDKGTASRSVKNVHVHPWASVSILFKPCNASRGKDLLQFKNTAL
jgi:hypothetical protein